MHTYGPPDCPVLVFAVKPSKQDDSELNVNILGRSDKHDDWEFVFSIDPTTKHNNIIGIGLVISYLGHNLVMRVSYTVWFIVAASWFWFIMAASLY